MKDLTQFFYQSKEIRVIQDQDGNPWWVAKDVCDVLGMVNSREAVSVLDDDEKNTVRLSDGSRGNPNINIITEAGLYTLIIRSNKPEAKKFKRWITHEVLPKIRKNGSYSHENLSPAECVLQMATVMVENERRLIEQDNRLKKIEAKIDFNSGYTGFWTIRAFCNMNGIKISLREAASRGKRAVALSRKYGIKTGKAYDEMFCQVNSYHEDVLVEIFSDLLPPADLSA